MEVAGHSPVDDVAEVAFEDAHCFLLGVAAGAGVVVDFAGSWLASKLGDCHAVQAGVDATVAAAVEAVADGFAVTLGAGGWQRCCAVEPGETAGAGEASGVTDLDEQLGFDACGDSAQLVECGAGPSSQLLECCGGLAVLGVEVGDSVSQGQLIGYSGNTGHTTMPHLHFAVYRATEWGNTQSIPIRFRSADGIIDRPRRGARYGAF